MKKLCILTCQLFIFSTYQLLAQNVGIGTTSPKARLEVVDSSVVFTGPGNPFSISPGNPPVSGFGSRMMWYADKAAFRAGFVSGTLWNKDSIGIGSFASGYDIKASGDYSTATGLATRATGTSSIAMGVGAIASGERSVALGENATASGDNSAAMGYNTTASGAYAIALGSYTRSRGFSCTAVGIYNNSIVAAQDVLTATTPLFIVGNGDDDDNRSNAMVVLKNGNIGIGTSTPDTKLHINGNSASGAPELLVQENEDDYARVSFKTSANPTKYWDEAAITKPVNGNAEFNFFYGGVGNILSLKGNGNATLTGTLTQNSDSRLKKNIIPISNALGSIMQLNGYSYNWKDEAKDQSQQIGVLAQEVQKIFPALVKADDKGMLSVNYIGFVPVLITAIKEQQQQMDSRQNQIDELKNEMAELKTLLQKK